MDAWIKNYNARVNIGLTLSQALSKAGLEAVDPNQFRGYWTSVWVHGKLTRCYARPVDAL